MEVMMNQQFKKTENQIRELSKDRDTWFHHMFIIFCLLQYVSYYEHVNETF